MTAELHTGSRLGYSALDWNEGYDVNLRDVIRQHPQLVLGRYVAIAWSDSGRYHLSDAEIAGGWQPVGDLAISPMVTDIAQLPTPGFDEWYVFERLPDMTTLSRFSSAIAFQPFGDGAKVDEFWSQIADLRPVHALLGGCPSLLLITRDTAVYERLLAHYSV
ncbi:hypothetical protein [Pseudomonas rubra]|uniref:Uncharacterized protein n=1 Tax=Pseudomonas rubra TaxID=2942627 RepID=A0ABT5PAJ4_9PSED|nr:hypothetical protein [Pseudomonas rubra]MDD1015201.1 hypothetical protein [Pseudomonas rubra]MDD1037855.1 hypothetical protein [Pseudomonas rubra]MDD1152817.1 hypothetical protein [Pseudomonas rubra]